MYSIELIIYFFYYLMMDEIIGVVTFNLNNHFHYFDISKVI